MVLLLTVGVVRSVVITSANGWLAQKQKNVNAIVIIATATATAHDDDNENEDDPVPSGWRK